MHLKTENCVICGKTAVYWHGHIIGKDKMALGNYIDKNVIAGFCNEHIDVESETACYGEYNRQVMGRCIQFKL